MTNQAFFFGLNYSNERVRRDVSLDSHKAQARTILRVEDYGVLASLAQSGFDCCFF